MNNNISCRKCRRSRQKLFLKGQRCFTAKCSLEKRNYPPGKDSKTMIRKMTEYGFMLREKQKVKFFYGISESQMRNYYEKANKAKGKTGTVLLSLCELRLDNIIKRSKFSKSRREARQLVGHGLFKVNGQKVDIASFLVKPGDVIEINEKKKELILKNKEIQKEMEIPSWLSFNEKDKTITVLSVPQRSEVEADIDEQLVVEYYSR